MCDRPVRRRLLGIASMRPNRNAQHYTEASTFYAAHRSLNEVQTGKMYISLVRTICSFGLSLVTLCALLKGGKHRTERCDAVGPPASSLQHPDERISSKENRRSASRLKSTLAQSITKLFRIHRLGHCHSPWVWAHRIVSFANFTPQRHTVGMK